ncbi:putative bifunctional diguanylate cyclase/phosphodiesterase [Deinococcus peraridilitoris]|uniref:Diguanylate cyclase (GGDEF) domain-containing protein n=1 Tax=Deinococcus peraridilitoris (strain DSM 19664 / LMG 22246 / CIP 109416 / KR-200) TaxID=937777 RepID=L0A0L3_DEIPD|nr:EAL domain-containing protein [Deinococcus peraridilitoris]AFZ67433.1 diguanylate cyclase (GGDEF) domain-containing protein [Deinococcus peraridilitoris DSM 19664]
MSILERFAPRRLLTPTSPEGVQRVLLILLFGLVVAHAVWLVSAPSEGTSRKLIGNLFFLMPYLVAGILTVQAAQAHRHHLRRAWAYLAAGLLTWAAGQAVFTVLDLRGAPTFPSLADVGFLSLPLLFVVGILHFFRAPPGRLQRLTFVLDVGMLFVTFGSVLWLEYVTTIWQRYAGQPFALLVAISYPFTDLLMIVVAFVLALWSPRESARAYQGLLGLGLLLFLTGSVGYGYLVSQDRYSVGDLIDVTWSGAALLFGLAAHVAQHTRGSLLITARAQAAISGVATVLLHMLPYGALVVSASLALSHHQHDTPAPHLDIGAGIVAVLALFRFLVSELHGERLRQQLRQQVRRDDLTGVLNRRELHAQIPQLVQDALARQQTVAVLFVDLDRFKLVNDTFGHEVGDALLLEASARIAGCIRPSDLLVRVGGDEFVVVLGPLQDTAAVEVVVQRILSRLTQPYTAREQQLMVTASIGIALVPADTRDALQALRFADLAMYQAKQQGRSTHRYYHAAIETESSERFDLEAQLQGALARQEFVLQYQPVVRTAGEAPSSFEALIRWQSHKQGVVSPAQFIPIAEERGLIVEIGQWVLNEALRQLRCWRSGGQAHLTVAVNISAVQFRHDHFAEMVQQTLARHELPGEALTLELTESSLMSDLEASRRVMAQLRALGVRFAMDDFGTGYSSLSYLRHLPVDVLKIDRSFVWSLDEVGVAVVRSIIALAHELQLKVVAEGVETREQLQTLRTLGSDEVQGYLIARPLSAEDAGALINVRPADPVS